MINEQQSILEVINFLNNEKKFDKKWNVQKIDFYEVNNILKTSSKKQSGYPGYPDIIYLNRNKKILILGEIKDSIKKHESLNRNKTTEYAVDGALWYLSRFKKENIGDNLEISNYIIISLAISGFRDEYKRISTFVLHKNKIEELEIDELVDENDYINIHNNIDLEKAITETAESAEKINNWLRDIDSQKRPILLAGTLIALNDKHSTEFLRSYKNIKSNKKILIDTFLSAVKNTLELGGVPSNKIDIVINELSFIKTNIHIQQTEILSEILDEISSVVIPLLNKNGSYDIVGKFYQDFLKYAGIANVKKGIVLTPQHISDLFTELVPITSNDIVLDPACGTGGFLISAMNKMIEKSDKKISTINNIKSKNLIGIETHDGMFTLAVANMQLRGDGKSQILHEDFFRLKNNEIVNIEKQKPSIIFMNPPYGGKDNKKNPTKKEIQFIDKALKIATKYVVTIVPVSTLTRGDDIRNKILKQHTLEKVISMPKQLFEPNASTITAIIVIKVGEPQENKKTIFYNLEEDGFKLSKSKGRVDSKNKWPKIKKQILTDLQNNKLIERKMVLENPKINQDWLIHNFITPNFEDLTLDDFQNTIDEFIMFKTKRNANKLNEKMTEIELLRLFNSINMVKNNE